MMKKVISVATLVILMAGSSSPAVALDGFTSNNTFRVRSISAENRDLSDATDDKQHYVDQTLDSDGKYEPFEGYFVAYKVKIANGVWGYSFNQDGTGANNDTELNIDYLYMGVEKENFLFTAGANYFETGNGWILQKEAPGATFQYRAPDGWVFDFVYSILDENSIDDAYNARVYYTQHNPGQETAFDVDGSQDEDIYAVQVTKKVKNGQFSAFWVEDINRENTWNLDSALGVEGKVNAFSVAGRYSIGDVNLEGEVATFTGEDITNDSDIVGTQFHLGAKYNLPTGQVSGNFYYAKGAEDGDTQISQIFKGGMQQPFQQGLGLLMDHDDDNHSMIPKPISIYEISENSGVIGAAINGAYEISQPLIISAGVYYLVPENEDTDSSTLYGLTELSAWTSMTGLNVGVTYEVGKHFMTGIGASYKHFETDSTGELDDAYCLGAQVSFFF